MPAKSKAQARAMFAAKEGKSTLGIPASVGAEFTKDMGKGDMKALPERKRFKRRKSELEDVPHRRK